MNLLFFLKVDIRINIHMTTTKTELNNKKNIAFASRS